MDGYETASAHSHAESEQRRQLVARFIQVKDSLASLEGHLTVPLEGHSRSDDLFDRLSRTAVDDFGNVVQSPAQDDPHYSADTQPSILSDAEIHRLVDEGGEVLARLESTSR